LMQFRDQLFFKIFPTQTPK